MVKHVRTSIFFAAAWLLFIYQPDSRLPAQPQAATQLEHAKSTADNSSDLVDPFSLTELSSSSSKPQNDNKSSPAQDSQQGTVKQVEPDLSNSSPTETKESATKVEADANSQTEKAGTLKQIETAEKKDVPKPAQQQKPDRQEAGGDNQQPKRDVVLAEKYQQAYVIDLHGEIFGLRRWYLENRIARAKNLGADLIVLRIKSPGGSLEHSIAMAQALRGVDWATTVAFIPEEAISGAAIISLGCDRIYLQPRALIGDAGPIRMDEGGQFQHAEEKILSYLATAVRELAVSQGRPAAIAEAMVDRKLKVIEVVHKQNRKRTFMSERELQQPENQGQYDVGNEIADAGQDRFLTVSGQRAVELQLAEGTFADEADLFKQLDVAKIEQTKLYWVDGLVFMLNRPWLTGLLLVIGLIGLYLEFSVPGMSVAGLVSLICFGIFFWSHALGGTSGWLEVMLFLLGVICLGFELFVFPGFGVFGLTGMLLIGLSLVMASQDFVVPNNAVQWNELQRNLLIVGGSIAGVMALLLVQLFVFDSLPGLHFLRLDAPVEEGDSPGANALTALTESPLFGLPELGARGTAESVLRPAGKGRFESQLIDVLTEGDFVDPGTTIEVVRREGNKIIVRKMAGQEL